MIRRLRVSILKLALATTLLPASAVAAPSDADLVRDDQWHLPFLRIQQVHSVSQGSGVVVAVPDTGVDPHPDLRENLLSGTDVIPGGSGDGRQDRDSHGTSMAGLIAAHGRPNNQGALGIAPKAEILPILDTPLDGQGDPDALAAAIEFAVARGADVISISAVAGASVRLQQALKVAQDANIIVVAAAGNRPPDASVRYPASETGVIAVGGVDRTGKHAAVSVTGPEVDVVAPAVDIYSTSYDGKYSKGTGTSSATAIVAGAAALIRSKYPYLPAQEVAHRLTATAIDKGPPGRDDEYGYGVIDLVAALTADVPPLGFESASAPADGGPTTTAGAQPDNGGGGRTTRGLATLGVIVAAGVGWALVVRRRRRDDDPPPRISR
ncbi:type VII secretion-associated serine protease mycosin [Micromonospora coriariae]|uniref:Type VII secretion-associated serine protease mycosin n=1 Tax=Micromonospora coriariae TaxID=285665 RepID=A0A1C4V920_9ACTN|nr:type VII secretion-associated serine protease mycosin [Micromonospora coriariae]SCE80259.1 type VII secretion-associated serine protease mycosin [Micromonospora coriariae]